MRREWIGLSWAVSEFAAQSLRIWRKQPPVRERLVTGRGGPEEAPHLGAKLNPEMRPELQPAVHSYRRDPRISSWESGYFVLG